MSERVIVVHCPRCGSTDAGSIGPVGIEFDRMRCQTCGHEDICDAETIKEYWNDAIPADLVRSRLPSHALPGERFAELWQKLGARDHGWAVFRRLRASYGEPHRAYHDASHIGACLRLLDDPAVSSLATHPAEVEAALWFHDAIYDPHAPDNEQASAQLAMEVFGEAGVLSEVVGRIGVHVRATKDHVALEADTQLVVDVDLSILGEEPSIFARFEAEIRREYAWVVPDAYVAGRSAVLRRLLERPSIYGTALFRDRYEARARANLLAALDRLREGVIDRRPRG